MKKILIASLLVSLPGCFLDFPEHKLAVDSGRPALDTHDIRAQVCANMTQKLVFQHQLTSDSADSCGNIVPFVVDPINTDSLTARCVSGYQTAIVTERGCRLETNLVGCVEPEDDSGSVAVDKQSTIDIEPTCHTTAFWDMNGYAVGRTSTFCYAGYGHATVTATTGYGSCSSKYVVGVHILEETDAGSDAARTDSNDVGADTETSD